MHGIDRHYVCFFFFWHYVCLHLISHCCVRDIFSVCLIDPELLQSKRKPFVFASVTVPGIISEVMMKCPLPLTGQHVAIATEHSIKFINSACHHPEVADR